MILQEYYDVGIDHQYRYKDFPINGDFQNFEDYSFISQIVDLMPSQYPLLSLLTIGITAIIPNILGLLSIKIIHIKNK